jgi:alpha-1,2-mannosyltransferase
VPWNIVRYNIFGGNERGPDLYGTSPWTFYFLNLLLNFNFLVPLALLALPSLAVTYKFDSKRLGFVKAGPDQTSPFTVLALRLLPFYLWFGILTLQAHKEERFMFPAYPLLCFNAAVTLYLMRGWIELAFISLTKSPYRVSITDSPLLTKLTHSFKASQSAIFKNFTFSVIVASSFISVSRILALWNYYHAPMSVIYNFEAHELPRLLNVSGLLPYTPEPDDLPQIDLSPIKDFNLRLCFAKEWYMFPGHYLVPDGVKVDFVKSEFNGLLPKHFSERASELRWWTREGTRLIPDGLNDLNQEEPQHYVNERPTLWQFACH